MTDSAEQQLRRIRDEIEHHRKKAARLRRHAERQDQIADDKVKEAAALGTPPLFVGHDTHEAD